MAELEKRTILVLGTCHISKATADLLTTTPVSKWPCVGGPYDEHGWFIYAHEDHDGRIPADLFAVMQFAWSNGCSNVLLDCDAQQVEGLPIYEW